MNGALGVRIQNRITAGGSSGGNVALVSGNGHVVLGEGIDASGVSGVGGSAALVATNGNVTLFDRIDAEGSEGGGTITLIGGGPINSFSSLRAGTSGLTGSGGVVTVLSGGEVLIGDVVNVDGFDGGQVLVSSTSSTTRITAPIVASGGRGDGGRVALSAGKNAIIASQVDADGGSHGGTISVDANSLISMTPQSALLARGETGGAITFDADAVSVVSGARVLVDGDAPGGTIMFAANNGDLILDGDFRARGRTGGSIEGMASGDVVAGGEFAARGDGCISLSAGSSLDISGGSFDVPLADSCP